MTEERRIAERRERERRTMALRGHGAGGVAPESSVSASNPCLNCGTNIQLRFCPECGQQEIDSDPTVREILHDVAQQLFGWDGKIFATFRLLVQRPGELTREYLAGRRVRYLSPVRVYLAASVLYFFIAAVAPDVSGMTVRVTPSHAQAGLTDSAAGVAGPDASRRVQRGMRRAQREPQAFWQIIWSRLPTLVFLLLPAFALATAIAYRGWRRHYPQHLTFALHVHAFVFLALSLIATMRFAGSDIVSALAAVIGFTALIWWTYAGLRRVYGGTHLATCVKLGAIAGVYTVMFVLALGALLIVSYYTFSPA